MTRSHIFNEVSNFVSSSAAFSDPVGNISCNDYNCSDYNCNDYNCNGYNCNDHNCNDYNCNNCNDNICINYNNDTNDDQSFMSGFYQDCILKSDL